MEAAGSGSTCLAAPCLQLPNRSVLTHLITTLGFNPSVFHGWGDFEGLKRESVPDGCKEKSRPALGRRCRGAASLPRSRELTSLSRTARGGKTHNTCHGHFSKSLFSHPLRFSSVLVSTWLQAHCPVPRHSPLTTAPFPCHKPAT